MTDDLAVARQERRIEYLDGVRGLGALSVVLHHFVVLLAPSLGRAARGATAWASQGPMLLITNGPFYVKVFFVLSGYVLANSVASGRTPLVASVVTRYFRLTVPMTVALLFTWMLGVTLPHPTLAFPLPSALAALAAGGWGVYLHGGPAANFPLWTMQFELAGSLAIYVCYKVPVRLRVPALVLLALVSLLRANGLGFALGALLREWHQAGKLRPSPWAWLGLVLYAYICCGGSCGLSANTANSPADHHFLPAFLYSVGAAGLIYFLLVTPGAQSFLRTRACQFLAYVSFGLYLVHYPLMFPLAACYGNLPGPLPVRLLELLAIFVVLSLITGWLLTRLIDDPLIRALKQWKKGWLARLTWRPAAVTLPD